MYLDQSNLTGNRINEEFAFIYGLDIDNVNIYLKE